MAGSGYTQLDAMVTVSANANTQFILYILQLHVYCMCKVLYMPCP